MMSDNFSLPSFVEYSGQERIPSFFTSGETFCTLKVMNTQMQRALVTSLTDRVIEFPNTSLERGVMNVDVQFSTFTCVPMNAKNANYLICNNCG